MLDDFRKGAFLKELIHSDAFQAQVGLEDQIYTSFATKLLQLDISHTNFQLEYAKIRGSLDALKTLKTMRETLIQQFKDKTKTSI